MNALKLIVGVLLNLCLVLSAFAGAAPTVPNKTQTGPLRKATLVTPKRVAPKPLAKPTKPVVRPAAAKTTALPAALRTQGSRYVLSVDTGGAELRAVFGRRTFRFNGQDRTLLELDDLLDPGANAVRLGWSGVRNRAAFTFIRLDGTRAQVLFRYTLDGALRPADGVLTVAVVRNDDPQGLASLSAFVAKGLVRVTLNGRGLGDYASFERRDITPFLREGRNIIKVQWSKDFGSSLPRGQITLQAGNRELVRWDGRYVPTLTGEQTIAFVHF